MSYTMLAECGRGSISLQSSVTYQVEIDQRKRSFESVKLDLVGISKLFGKSNVIMTLGGGGGVAWHFMIGRQLC